MLVANTAAATTAPAPMDRTTAREVLRSLIEIDTTAAHGTLAVAQAIADRLAKAGFTDDSVQVLAPADQPSQQYLDWHYSERFKK